MRRVVVGALTALAFVLPSILAVPQVSADAPAISRLPLDDADDMSGDGRFVTFSSANDVFVLDASTGFRERVSVSTSGEPGNGRSDDSDISPDGRFIVFTSYASNLVSHDTNASADVFLRDRLRGRTIRLSVTDDEEEAMGRSFGGSVSGDGRYIAFVSWASNLGSPDAVGVYVRDRVAGTTTLMGSLGASFDRLGPPQISTNGQFVAWMGSYFTGELGCTDSTLLVQDRTGSQVEYYGGSCDVTGDFSLSADGRFVGYTWELNGDGNVGMIWGRPQTWSLVVDRKTNASYRFPGSQVVLSADGTRAFAGGDALRVFDTVSHRTEVLRVAAQGGFVPIGASSSGERVLFRSWAPNLVERDRGFDPDVFLAGAASPSPPPLIARGEDVAQADGGRIVVAATVEDPTGDLDPMVLRYTESGELDPTFDADGIAMVDDRPSPSVARVVAVQSDGSVLVGVQGIDETNPWASIHRLNPDGEIDRSFANDGALLLRDTLLGDVQVLSRGRILVSATALYGGGVLCVGSEYESSYRPCAAVSVRRLMPSGAPDPSFAGGEVLVDRGTGEYGEDLFAGRFALYRGDYYVFTSGGLIRIADGVHDSDFGSNGFASFGCGLFVRSWDLTLHADVVVTRGTPVVASSSGINFCATRFTSGGQIDTAFGIDGTAIVATSSAVSPYRDGYLADLRVDARGRLILGGWTDPGTMRPKFAVVRLTSTGQPDTAFSSDGSVTISAWAWGWSQAGGLVLASGRPVLVGASAPPGGTSLDVGMVKLLPNGAPDRTFGDGDGRLITLLSA